MNKLKKRENAKKQNEAVTQKSWQKRKSSIEKVQLNELEWINLGINLLSSS